MPQTTAQLELGIGSTPAAEPTPLKRRTRGAKQRPVVDLASANSVDYNDWVPAMGWSYSKGRRAKPLLPVLVTAFGDRIIPVDAERALRGERLPSRRGRPRRRAT